MSTTMQPAISDGHVQSNCDLVVIGAPQWPFQRVIRPRAMQWMVAEKVSSGTAELPLYGSRRQSSSCSRFGAVAMLKAKSARWAREAHDPRVSSDISRVASLRARVKGLPIEYLSRIAPTIAINRGSRASAAKISEWSFFLNRLLMASEGSSS